MSEESNRTPEERKKRVKALKKLIIQILAISIIIPWICCVVLFCRVNGLSHSLQDTANQLEELNNLLLEQQKLLDEIREESNIQGEVVNPVNESAKESSVTAQETVPGATEIVEKEAAHKVYLTFDDGPSEYTDEILDILDQYEVKATFFVVGKEDEASKEALKEIVERGHSLGMHSFSHKYSEIYESVERFEEDLLKIQSYLYDVTGVRSMIYRFPGGSSNRVSDLDMQLFAECLQEQAVTFYDWNISSGDGGSRLLPVEDLVDNCTKEIALWDTSIVLMHDSTDKRTTVEALPIIIENILALEDTVILPITEDTEPVQHINTIYTKVKE